jgi:hypothetical protein
METEAMKTFLQLLVLAAIGYAFWVYGLPWVQRTVGQARAPVSSPAPGAGGACVQAAARASEKLHDELMETARTLLEDSEWDRIVSGVDDAMFQARESCKCNLESCGVARSALAELSAVFDATRASNRTSQSIPLDQGRLYEKANQLLWDAYDLAKAGQ